MKPIITSTVPVVVSFDVRSVRKEIGIVETEIMDYKYNPSTSIFTFKVSDFLIINHEEVTSEGEIVPAWEQRKLLKQSNGLNHKFVDMPEEQYNGLMDFFNTNMPEATHNLRLAHGLLQITQAAPIYIKEDGTATLPNEWMIKE